MSLPPSEIPSGAMRFNSDSQKLEYWNGSQWVQVHTFSPNLDGGARGVFAGGQEAPTIHGDIEYINIASTGNSVDFGADLTTARRRGSAFSSNTRGVFNGGSTPVASSVQDYITISSTGTCTAWGDTLNNTGSCDNAAFSNSTRGITKAGYTSPGVTGGTMDYVTIASAGNTVNFGNLIDNGDASGAASNSVRGLFGGCFTSPTTGNNVITFVTIATLGDAIDFGDLTQARHSPACVSSKIRAVWAAGGNNVPTWYNIIDYVNISTLGNAVNFGDIIGNMSTGSGVSNCIRGVFAGGYTPASSDVIQYINISTEGDAVDFGDLTVRSGGKGMSCSNAHGGL